MALTPLPTDTLAGASGVASILFSSTSIQTIAATTTETTIIGSSTSVGNSLTLPANFFYAGKGLRFQVRGVYSTPALNVGNILVKIKLGSTVLASGTASALLISATNVGFVGDCLITCQTVGASGSIVMMAGVTYGVANNTAPFALALNNGITPITIDTTSTQVFNVTITWSNNTAGNSISSLNCILEGLN